MNSISRRGFLAGMSCLAATGSAHAAPSLPSSNALNFRVIRDGSDIGFHRLTFDQNSAALTVRTEVQIVVKLGPIPVYHYRHSDIERYDRGVFQSSDSETVDAGTKLVVSMRRGSDKIVVDGTKSGRYLAPLNALPATHWNKEMLTGPLIDPEDGTLFNPVVTPEDWQAIPLASGSRVEARLYALTGDMKLNLWYDHQNQWSALQLEARDSSSIHYMLA